MLTFDDISPETLLARGKYSTIRKEHEDEKQNATVEIGQAMALLSALQRGMQKPDFEPDLHLDGLEGALNRLRAKAAYIAQLATQRAAIKAEAWPN